MGDWRFLLDENVDPKTATYLAKADIDTEHVRDALWGRPTKPTCSRTRANTTGSS